jgi:hypothetical protein
MIALGGTCIVVDSIKGACLCDIKFYGERCEMNLDAVYPGLLFKP